MLDEILALIGRPVATSTGVSIPVRITAAKAAAADSVALASNGTFPPNEATYYTSFEPDTDNEGLWLPGSLAYWRATLNPDTQRLTGMVYRGGAGQQIPAGHYIVPTANDAMLYDLQAALVRIAQWIDGQ